MASALTRGRKLYAAMGAGLAVLGVAALPSAARAASAGAATATAVPVAKTLSAAPLGINVGPWDYAYSMAGSAAIIQSLLKAAGVRQLRYGGGSSADTYDWQTNTSIQGCLPYNATASFTSSCASSQSLSFGQFSRQARALGASSFVTVNYGSGTPAEAAAWVKAAKGPGQNVALWEVGNESYGCWEVNNELAGAPEKYPDYTPGVHNAAGQNPTCPMVTQGTPAGMRTMATSYAVNAKRFLVAMKAADPTSVTGVPWAFGGDVPGAAVGDSLEWNDIVLGTDAREVNFVDAHYYPFGYAGSTGGSNPTIMQVLGSLWHIPALYREIRAELNKHTPKAAVVVGETGVSNHPTLTTCTPAGALFAAGDVLSWLAAGAQSVDWWDMDNYGDSWSRCAGPAEGMFSAAPKPVAYTPYYGYLLASLLAQPHARLAPLSTSDSSDVLAFQAVLPSGKKAVALININPARAERVTFGLKLTGILQTWHYSAGSQNATQSKIVAGTTAATAIAHGITLPAQSITILRVR
jgi:hypothetical protein